MSPLPFLNRSPPLKSMFVLLPAWAADLQPGCRSILQPPTAPSSAKAEQQAELSTASALEGNTFSERWIALEMVILQHREQPKDTDWATISKLPAASHIGGAVTHHQQHPWPQEPATGHVTSKEGEQGNVRHRFINPAKKQFKEI